MRDAEREHGRPSPAAALGGLGLLVVVQWLATRALIAVGQARLPAAWVSPGWPYGYLSHAAQLVVAVAIIAILRSFTDYDFGLRWPRGRSYALPALWVGLAAGVAMLVVDNGPDLLHRHAPEGPYDPSWPNLVPWLLMQGVFVGITEEVPFRSLFLGYLLSRWPASVAIGGVRLSIATVVTAFVFSLAHVPSFWTEPLVAAAGQQAYVVALGLFYGWLFERSGSVLAPILCHNAGDVVEWSLLFAMRAAWG